MSEADKASSPEGITAPTASPPTVQKRNAFTELLSSRSKQQKPDTNPIGSSGKNKMGSNRRDDLGAYVRNPESFPKDVIYQNEEFVAIRDKFPKSSLHLLLLPRDRIKMRKHPFEAFKDAEFLEKVKVEAGKLQKLAASELRRMYGKDSAQEKVRQAALDAHPPPDELPAGRDWVKEIKCGVHAVPSMNDLHIHVIAVDHYSERMKHRKHYNSFATPFFVPLEDFPLKSDDSRWHPEREGYLRRDLVCWRCGRNFGNSFEKLKTHLWKEFGEWKKI